MPLCVSATPALLGPDAMHAHVYTDPTGRAGLVELGGCVRWTDIAASVVALYGRPDANPHLATLWDGRGITSLDILPDDVSRLRVLLRRLFPNYDGGRTAVLVSRGLDAEFAPLLIRCGPGCRREFKICMELGEALDFLGHPDLPLIARAEFERANA